LDRLTQETTPQGTVTYTYDADGRRATMTVAGQSAVSYGYDIAHRLTAITQGAAVVALSYDDADRRSTLTYPNGIVATSGYDTANQLTSLAYTLGQTTLGDLTYAYDLAGNRTNVGGSWARTGLPQALTSATYDDANRLATWGPQNFSYDLNGNLASDGPTSYTWNARNQLSSITGGGNASFAYDGLRRRRGKTVSATTTNFLYDGVNLVQELAGSTPTANMLTGDVDETFTRADSSGTSTLLIDALGSELALADVSGVMQTQYTFDSFGATSASGIASSNSLQFTGRENDGTGLYFYRARYHDPTLGRFISEDPLEFAASTNLYAYVNNNPVFYVDPFGLQAVPPSSSVYSEGDVWAQAGQGSADMWKNFRRMQERGWQNADKYYHCMGNCQATNRGPGGAAAARIISDLRTWRSTYTEPNDWRKDQEANRCGQKGGDCEKLCAPFIPPSSAGRPPFPGW
jgi:RHS repeat-associated protein